MRQDHGQERGCSPLQHDRDSTVRVPRGPGHEQPFVQSSTGFFSQGGPQAADVASQPSPPLIRSL